MEQQSMPTPRREPSTTGARKEAGEQDGKTTGGKPQKRGPVAGSAQARKGGQAVLATHGPAFFAMIGRKGGQATRQKHGLAFYAQIGKIGGAATRGQHDSACYAQIASASAQSKKRGRPIPTERTVTYQSQRRRCKKATCHTCRQGEGHGPYWYAYWRENGKLVSAYVGKHLPPLSEQAAL